MLVRSIMLFLSLVSLAPVVAVGQVESIVLDEPSKFVRLTGEINDVSVSQFVADLTVAADGDSPEVLVFIDSGGGEVLAGLRAIDAVVGLKKEHPALVLKCYAHSAASMAFFILQSACDRRIVSEYSILMQHQASLGMRGKWGEIQSRTELFSQTINLLEKKIAARLGLSLPDYRARVVNDWWLVGHTAVREKAADSIGVASCSAALVKAKQCPLVYAPLSNEGDSSRGQSAPSGERSPPRPAGK